MHQLNKKIKKKWKKKKLRALKWKLKKKWNVWKYIHLTICVYDVDYVVFISTFLNNDKKKLFQRIKTIFNLEVNIKSINQ